MMRQRVRAGLLLLAVPALALLAPSGSGPYAPLLSAVADAAWLCTGWLALVAVLESGSCVPGEVGRLTARAARRVAPASVRGLVRLAVGASLAASVLSGPAALAEDRTPTVAGSSTDYLDWPGLAPTVTPPMTPTAAPTATATAAPPATAPATASAAPAAPAATAPVPTRDPQPAPRTVVVQPGDSLWSIARDALGPGATDRQVAAAWPRWWAANRPVVRDTPDLIHPGDRLTAP